jgi:hypothetical protein
MLIRRLAVTGLHWTARTLVSLLNTRARARRAKRREAIRGQLEIASPQATATFGDLEAEEVLNIRTPDADLLATLDADRGGR